MFIIGPQSDRMILNKKTRGTSSKYLTIKFLLRSEKRKKQQEGTQCLFDWLSFNTFNLYVYVDGDMMLSLISLLSFLNPFQLHNYLIVSVNRQLRLFSTVHRSIALLFFSSFFLCIPKCVCVN